MEQYPLGGIEGVRGYENCSAHVDHACLIHIDIRSPQTSLLKYVRQKFESLDRCSGAFFLDVGNGWTEGSNEMDRSSIYLIGLGPGLRYELLDYVNGRIDIGIQTTKAPLEGTFDSKVRCNFSINAAY
jgi:hemolysin activation/secretion protein